MISTVEFIVDDHDNRAELTRHEQLRGEGEKGSIFQIYVTPKVYRYLHYSLLALKARHNIYGRMNCR